MVCSILPFLTRSHCLLPSFWNRTKGPLQLAQRKMKTRLYLEIDHLAHWMVLSVQIQNCWRRSMDTADCIEVIDTTVIIGPWNSVIYELGRIKTKKKILLNTVHTYPAVERKTALAISACSLYWHAFTLTWPNPPVAVRFDWSQLCHIRSCRMSIVCKGAWPWRDNMCCEMELKTSNASMEIKWNSWPC